MFSIFNERRSKSSNHYLASERNDLKNKSGSLKLRMFLLIKNGYIGRKNVLFKGDIFI